MRRPIALAAAVTLVWSILGQPAFGGTLSLDSQFGQEGFSTTRFRENAGAHAVAVQKNGKLVLAGEVGRRANAQPDAFAVARYTRDGVLDRTFGGDGRVSTAFGRPSAVSDVSIDSHTKIVAAGTGGVRLAVARYLRSGKLDRTFSGDGKRWISFGVGETEGVAAAMQADGKVVVAGRFRPETGAVQFAIARLGQNGALDRTFGSGGKVVTTFGKDTYLADMVVDDRGRILVVGTTVDQGSRCCSDIALVRYLPTGVLDSAFGKDGVVTGPGSLSWAATAVVLSNKRIVVSALDGSIGGVVVRYFPNGGLDKRFGKNGISWLSSISRDISPYDVAVRRSGAILLCGAGGEQDTFGLEQLTPTGKRDASFGHGGRILTTIRHGVGGTYFDLEIQTDGKVVAGGATRRPTDSVLKKFMVARYASMG